MSDAPEDAQSLRKRAIEYILLADSCENDAERQLHLQMAIQLLKQSSDLGE